MQPITTLTSRYVVLAVDDIDTDQIIPARFLTTTSREGLGPHAFRDWRYHTDGSPRKEFPLNHPDAAGAGVLVAGRNFGCGSSREHAAWALMGAGFRVVLSPAFADIFRGNALQNGLLPIAVSEETITALRASAVSTIAPTVTVDLRAQVLALPNAESVRFEIDPFAKRCLLDGVNALGYLLSERPSIDRYERVHPPRIHTLSSGT